MSVLRTSPRQIASLLIPEVKLGPVILTNLNGSTLFVALHRIAALTWIGALVLSFPSAQSTVRPAPEIRTTVDEYMKAAVTVNGFSGSILVAPTTPSASSGTAPPATPGRPAKRSTPRTWT